MIFPFTAATAEVISEGGNPIHIVSDRFDVYADKQMAVFSGNVVVTQEDTTINADEFRLYYKKEDGQKKENKQIMTTGVTQASDIEKIEAKGHVVITQREKMVKGEQAVFLNEEQKIVVTGNPVMKDGDNEIRGDRIIFFTAENRGVVESSSRQRVTATIYPEEKKQ